MARNQFVRVSVDETYKLGHSLHGPPFGTGPRERPWIMPGIGEAHLPITTKNPEVQKWFDQGNALLHSFREYEAERSFRWCLKLEPENAMAYWGLARAASGDRAKDFVREALKRKDRVSPREQLYIDALAAQILPDALKDKDGAPDPQEMNRRYKKALETICVNYPDDMEARALLALATMGRDRYATELIIREARMPVLLNRRFFARRAVLHSENGSCRDNQRRLHL